MSSRAILTIVLATLALAGVLTGCDSEESGRSGQRFTKPTVQPTSGERTLESTGGVEATDGAGGEECREPESTQQEIRIGDFEPPEEAPPYEVIEERPVDGVCVGAVRLLVDTRANDKAGYTKIARDIKAEYAELDAITVEFTDTSGSLSYEGSALIFNTPSGSYFMGSVYGPPNNEGYYITVAR